MSQDIISDVLAKHGAKVERKKRDYPKWESTRIEIGAKTVSLLYPREARILPVVIANVRGNGAEAYMSRHFLSWRSAWDYYQDMSKTLEHLKGGKKKET